MFLYNSKIHLKEILTLNFKAFGLQSPDAGLFTAHFSPGDRGIHLVSHRQKVNVPAMPGVGGAGVSHDWCISSLRTV